MLAAALVGSALAQDVASDIQFWKRVKDSTNAADIQSYLKAFPEGRFAPVARVRLQSMESAAAAAPAKPAPPENPPPAAASSQATPAPNNDAADIAFWQSVKDTSDAAELESYISTFPKGLFVELARLRLAKLQKPKAPEAQQPKPPSETPAPQTKAPTQRPSDEAWMRGLDAFGDALELIRNNYVDKPNDAQLLSDAIDGIVEQFPGIVGEEAITEAKQQLRTLNAQPDSIYKQLDVVGDVLEAAFQQAKSEQKRQICEAAILGMLKRVSSNGRELRISQRESGHWRDDKNVGGIGLEITFKDDHHVVVSAIPDTPAAEAGLRPGDIIVKVDGAEVSPVSMETLVKSYLHGPIDSKTTLTLLRDGKTLDVSITRRAIHLNYVTLRLEGDIGYIRIASFGETTTQKVQEALTSLKTSRGGPLKGLVLDIRSNTGGLLEEVVALADSFLQQGTINVMRGRNKQSITIAKSGEIAPSLPLVVLINEQTTSGAEVLGAALQENGRARLVGTRTTGFGVIDTYFPMSDGTGIKITTGRIYRPGGLPLDGNGLKPDIDVAASKSGSDEDAPLKAALAVFQSVQK